MVRRDLAPCKPQDTIHRLVTTWSSTQAQKHSLPTWKEYFEKIPGKKASNFSSISSMAARRANSWPVLKMFPHELQKLSQFLPPCTVPVSLRASKNGSCHHVGADSKAMNSPLAASKNPSRFSELLGIDGINVGSHQSVVYDPAADSSHTQCGDAHFGMVTQILFGDPLFLLLIIT